MVGLDAHASEAIRCLDEHWNGGGHPDGLSGEAIPLLGRILCLAQTVEVFLSAHGRDAAYENAAARSGSWFDPQLVDALGSFRDDTGSWGGSPARIPPVRWPARSRASRACRATTPAST